LIKEGKVNDFAVIAVICHQQLVLLLLTPPPTQRALTAVSTLLDFEFKTNRQKR
jgi:hypothetical protein